MCLGLDKFVIGSLSLEIFSLSLEYETEVVKGLVLVSKLQTWPRYSLSPNPILCLLKLAVANAFWTIPERNNVRNNGMKITIWAVD